MDSTIQSKPVISAPPQTSSDALAAVKSQKEDEMDLFAKLAKYEAEHKKDVKKKKKAKTSFVPSSLNTDKTVRTSFHLGSQLFFWQGPACIFFFSKEQR